MTSAERALRLVRERRFHKLDMDAVRALAKHADAANLSVGDLDEAAWLSRAIDAAVAEALAARDATAPKPLTLDGIIGQRVGFCGVDNNTIALLVWDRIRAFEVVEDEDDGYRSSLKEVREVPIGNMIHFRTPVAEVVVTKIETTRCDGYQFADGSGHVWLQVGTDDSCDYYPCFVFDYTPPKRPVVAEVPRWVLVGEWLPDYGDDVLMMLSNGTRRVGWHAINCDDEEGWTDGDGGDFDVVAWQPLPAPWVAP